MQYQRGERVRVVGFEGKEAVLWVWGTCKTGVLLTTAEGFAVLSEGREAPYVGFPLRDIKEKVTAST